MQQNNQVNWVHQDPVAKSKRVTNSAGSVVSTIELDPWGGDTNRSNNEAFQPRRFTTYDRDGNASDEAMHRRYNRWHSRFDQPDPYGGSYDMTNPQSFNRYSYVQNDPVNFMDPSGLDPEDPPPPMPSGPLDRIITNTNDRSPRAAGYFGDGTEITIDNPGSRESEGVEPNVDPQESSPNPCNDFAEALANRLYNALYKGLGSLSENVANLAKAMRQNAMDYKDEFGKSMKKLSVRGFKKELVDNGQGSDVYRHVMYVASTYLDNQNALRRAFTNFDRAQARAGRKQSETESRDNAAGIEVGKLMLDVVNAFRHGQHPDFKALHEAIHRVLCNQPA